MKKIKITPIESELRDAGSLIDAEIEFCKKVWYSGCYLRTIEDLKNGDLKIVKKWKPEYSTQNLISKDILQSVKKAAKKIERKLGKKNLGPYDDFDWGMINGKLSAIRWMLGDDWDQLDT
jgi:hypothetical protein